MIEIFKLGLFFIYLAALNTEGIVPYAYHKVAPMGNRVNGAPLRKIIIDRLIHDIC